jgi:hypothetical protein
MAVRWRAVKAPFLGGVFVAAAFTISRVAYFLAGVRFDTSPINYFAQLLDPPLLRDRLAESLFYLHAQPPLYNLLVGIALKLAPTDPAFVLAPVFLASSLYAALALYALVRGLRAPIAVAALTAAAAVATPLWVEFENWCFYPQLNVAWILGAAAWFAHSRGRPGPSLAIAAAHVGGLCLTRSLFHPLYFVAVTALFVLGAGAGNRRRALVCCAAPAVLLFAVCAKNLVLFDFFGTSSWSSRNLSRAVVNVLGPERVAAQRSHLSRAVDLDAFERGDRNISAFKLRKRRTGVPALDEIRKSKGSALRINFNHWSYPASAGYYLADAKRLILAYPGAYLGGTLVTNVPRFFGRIDADDFVESNRARIERVSKRFARFERSAWERVLVAGGLALSFAALVRRRTPRAARLVLAFVWVTLAWVTVVGVFGEYGENHRFRYNIIWLGWAASIAAYGAYGRALWPLLRRMRDSRTCALRRDPLRGNVPASPRGRGV